jgi:hypothetical protein
MSSLTELAISRIYEYIFKSNNILDELKKLNIPNDFIFKLLLNGLNKTVEKQWVIRACNGSATYSIDDIDVFYFNANSRKEAIRKFVQSYTTTICSLISIEYQTKQEYNKLFTELYDINNVYECPIEYQKFIDNNEEDIIDFLENKCSRKNFECDEITSEGSI